MTGPGQGCDARAPGNKTKKQTNSNNIKKQKKKKLGEKKILEEKIRS
jgi:hypothetical protein